MLLKIVLFFFQFDECLLNVLKFFLMAIHQWINYICCEDYHLLNEFRIYLKKWVCSKQFKQTCHQFFIQDISNYYRFEHDKKTMFEWLIQTCEANALTNRKKESMCEREKNRERKILYRPASTVCFHITIDSDQSLSISKRVDDV